MLSLRSPDHVLRLESELLSQVYSLRGQAMLSAGTSSTGAIREALEAFLESAR